MTEDSDDGFEFPTVCGPLHDPEYIEDITEQFVNEKGRQPYGADELLHWHRRKINESLKEEGVEVAETWEIRELDG